MKTSEKNQLRGEHYTPPSLAQFVVWSGFQAFFNQQLPISRWSNLQMENFEMTITQRPSINGKIDEIKILDLGAGDGAFLLATGKFLERIHSNSKSIDSTNIRLHILEKNLHGVDSSSRAVISCRREIKKWIIGNNNPDQDSNLIQKIEKSLTQKIRVGNVLFGDIFQDNTKNNSFLLENEETKLPFHWYKEFSSVFKQEKLGFDLVLCNPPYVTKEISPEDVRLYRQLYRNKIFVNRFNLYHLFFARVKDLLAPNGTTVFLTANSILTDSYSIKMRDFLSSHFTIKIIVDFVNRTHIFPNVLQGTCILGLCKKNGEAEKQQTQIIRTFDMTSLNKGKSVEGWISTPRLIQFKKIISSPHIRTLEILEFLNQTCLSLRTMFKIQSGEIRPADSNIRPYYFKSLPEDDSLENYDVILNGKNIHPYLINLEENRQKPRWYKRPKSEDKQLSRQEHSQSPRIVFQRITAREQLRRVIAGKIDRTHLVKHGRIWAENNINYLLLSPGSTSHLTISSDTLLGIFNSLLINWFLHQINLTAAIPPADLGLIPLPKIISTNNDSLIVLQQKVVQIPNLLEGCSSSSEIYTQLCPHCTSTGEINKIQSEIDELVFLLYELPDKYQKEIRNQLSSHHQYFNHH